MARKTLARRTNEPRGTLKPLCNIIPVDTITNYTPTSITRDTHNRKNTVIRKNDLAIVKETKPRLIHFVACKTVREHKRNQEKMKEFLLTEKKNNKKTHPEEQRNECIRGPSTQMDQPGPSETQWTQPAKNPKQPKRKGMAPHKRTYKPNKDFDQRSKKAALTKLEKARQRQKDKINSLRIPLDTKSLHKDNSVEVINLASDSSQGSPLQIFTSNNPNAFMHAPPNNKDNSPTKRDEKINKIIRRITNSPKKTPLEPDFEQIITIIPASTSTPIGNNTKILQRTDNKQTPQPSGNDNEDTPQQDTEKQTTKPTGSDNNTQQHSNIQQTSTLPNDKIQALQQTNKGLSEPPEERQDTNTERENIHREDQEDDYSGTSSISSLNTADIEALNKIFG